MARAPQFDVRDGFVRGLMLVTAIVVLGLLAVRLADVILMAFGAVLVGVLLHAVAAPLERWLRLPRTAALTGAVALIVVAVGLMLWAFGSQAEAQFANLSDLLPRAWAALRQRLQASPMGALILPELNGATRAGGWLMGYGARVAANAAGVVAGTVIVFFAGLYLAFHPESYLGGVLMLFPRRVRTRAAEVFEACHAALRQWLVGQLISMVLVGATTALGLWLVGVPSAIALGLIAGLGQFIPVVGPMAATIPGLLAALAAGPQTFAWAAAVYLASSQLEANVITPLVLRQMAQLPMAVTLFAVLAMGVLLGALGVLFATPLAVVAYVVVRKVYVEGVLGERLDGAGRGGA